MTRQAALSEFAADETRAARDPELRGNYLSAALAVIPRLLTAMDRNPYHATYGCLDRQFWHYRTADFPCGMHQEGLLPLALVYAHPFERNRWHGSPQLRELVVAALRFTFFSGHREGSCDDYYPFERALGATVFSLVAAAEAYQLLELDDPEIAAGIRRRARWVMRRGESGRLANHHALAGLGMYHSGVALDDVELREAADARLSDLLAWQSSEGWFEEYGGADPGYTTVTIECLARYRALAGAVWLDEPLARAVGFTRWFLHVDDSFAGEYGSRGTRHYYPHGMELLAGQNADAADLADGFLRTLGRGRAACFDDDRLVAHRAGSLLRAWMDWAPVRKAAANALELRSAATRRHFVDAGLFVRQSDSQTVVVSLARGGVLKRVHRDEPPRTDGGLIVELEDGRIAVSHMHDRRRAARATLPDSGPATFVVEGPLHFMRHETATPGKLVLFRILTTTLGRWARGLVRRLLQRRLITGRRKAPIQLRRTIRVGDDAIEIEDQIELTDPLARVVRMSYGVDHEPVYVAATGVYQDDAIQEWTHLSAEVPALNTARRVVVRRTWREPTAHFPREARVAAPEASA